jgi:hypothetical protein
MTTAIETIDRRSGALAETAPDGFTAFIQKLATSDAVDVEKAKALMELYLKGQRGMQEMQDEREYYSRMAEFKRNPPEVIKRLTAKIQGSSKSGRDYAFDVPYADLNAFSDAAMANLAERGITWDFEVVDKADTLTVTCLLHYGLYTRRGSTISGDPKLLQSPNPFMQKGSAQSYLMRYSFCASTGLTAALPSDKNGAVTGKQEPGEVMDESVASDFIAAIEGSGDTDELQRNYFAARDAAQKMGDKRALNAFAEAKNRKYKKLVGGTR